MKNFNYTIVCKDESTKYISVVANDFMQANKYLTAYTELRQKVFFNFAYLLQYKECGIYEISDSQVTMEGWLWEKFGDEYEIIKDISERRIDIKVIAGDIVNKITCGYLKTKGIYYTDFILTKRQIIEKIGNRGLKTTIEYLANLIPCAIVPIFINGKLIYSKD